MEYTSSIIKEENNLEIKQEEVNFELIDTEDKLPSEVRTKVEENCIPNDIKEEEEDESNAMDFAYVQVDQVEQWTEHPAQKTDPLATSFAKEINDELNLLKEEDIAASTQGMRHPAMTSQYTFPHSTLESVCTEQELCINSDNSTSKYRNTRSIHDKVILCSNTTLQSPPKKFEKLVSTAEKVYNCTICEYSCRRSNSLKRHMKLHTGEKPYKCTVCDYSCNQSGNLKVHMKLHTGEKPYKCTICKCSFSQVGYLKRHMILHTGEKPYKCTLCDYSCNKLYNLNVHMKLHTGEKPYKCTVCEYSFSQAGNLKQHTRLHTGEKPYKCTVCEYSFSQASNLKRHMRLHIG